MDISVWIERHAARTPDKTALICGDTATSYAEFAARIGFLADVLAARGIGPGDRVALLSTNHPDYAALLFAAARLGAVLVPLNWRLAPAELGYIVADAGAKLLIFETAFAASVPGGVAALAREALDRASAIPAARAGALELPVLIVYTSGTTGRPKGAVLTQDALVWNAINSQHMHDLTADDRVLTNLPMFHVGGLNIQTLPALRIGATVMLQPRFDPSDALAAIAAFKPTLTLVVPATMKALIAHPAWAATDLSCLRLAGAGSSVVPLDLIRAFHARGVPVAQVYGATETGPIAICQGRDDAMANEGAIGRPALHCEARLAEDGEILIRGPNVAAGYWNDPQATAEAFADGWFRTGDLGRIDANGQWHALERKKDMVISGGENIYPAELETALLEHAGIADCAVVTKPDAKWGEVPVAFVVAKPDATLDAEALAVHLDGRLARFKWPKEYRFVDALPRNAMGKLLRFELRGQAREDRK